MVDQIYLIDHRSTKDLGQISLDRVKVIVSSQRAQFQSEVTNALIRDFKLYEKFDWIFVLDIDEFLPYKCKTEFHLMLLRNQDQLGLKFQWRNGVGVYPSSLAKTKKYKYFHELTSVFLSKLNNPTQKSQ